MTLSDPLRNNAVVDNINNVVIFISDSVRYDSVPSTVKSKGVTAKAVAPSTFTASSVPSILTGQYPSHHHIWSFEDELGHLPTLFTGPEDAVFDYDEEFHLQPRIINSPPRKSLNDLASPFIYVYHDRGGHFPYGRSFESYPDMHSFFDEYTDTETLRELYHESVNESADRFIELIDTLEDASILENTLLVFISDHGEVLGEHGGLFTHAIPMVPELTEIPIVFVGAGLPKDQEMDALLSGTDIVPTVLNALGREPPKQVDGSDIWRQPPDSSQLLRSEVWKQTKYERLKSYVAGGVWDKNGGYVSHRGSWVDRFVYASGVHLIKGPHASVARTLSVSNYWEMFKAHLPSKIRYGDPDFEFSDAMEAIPEFEREESVTEPDVDRERLKQLGYLE